MVRRALAFLFTLGLSLSPCAPQGFSGDGFGTQGFFQNGAPAAPPSTYVGVGDVVSGFTTYYALRAYTAAIAAAGTQRLVQVVGATSAVTCDVLVATNGGLGLTTNCTGGGGDNGQTAQTFCTVTSTSCTVEIVYDQGSLGANMVNSVVAVEPTLVFNCLGTLPCLTFLASATQVLRSTWTAQAQPLNYTSVANRTGAFTTLSTVFGSGNSVQLGFNSAVSSIFIFAGTLVSETGHPDSAWHNVQETFTGASSAINIDGTDTTGISVGTNGLSAGSSASNIGASGAASNFFTGSWAESGWAAGTWTSAQRGALCHNQYTYWGTSVSC